HIPADLPFLADHFPGMPILPGSLQIELCAQIAGPLAEQAVAAHHQLERWAFLGMVRSAKLYQPVRLPADLELAATLGRVDPTAVIVEVTATCDQVTTCRAELVMVMREAEPGWADAIAAARGRR